MKKTKESYEKITSKSQKIKVGDKLRLYSSRYQRFFNYTIKKCIEVNGNTEIILDIKSNKYFILDCVLNNEKTWGGWVTDIYRKIGNK